MRTTAPELEQMLRDPEQFVNLALDTCDKQKSKVVKTQGAKLLEAICDNIDGAVSFITIFCCQSLHYSLKNNNQFDGANTKHIEEFENTRFL